MSLLWLRSEVSSNGQNQLALFHGVTNVAFWFHKISEIKDGGLFRLFCSLFSKTNNSCLFRFLSFFCTLSFLSWTHRRSLALSLTLSRAGLNRTQQFSRQGQTGQGRARQTGRTTARPDQQTVVRARPDQPRLTDQTRRTDRTDNRELKPDQPDWTDPALHINRTETGQTNRTSRTNQNMEATDGQAN